MELLDLYLDSESCSFSGLVLGLVLEASGLVLGLVLEASGLGLDLDLVVAGLDTSTTASTSCAGGRHNMPPPLQVDL